MRSASSCAVRLANRSRTTAHPIVRRHPLLSSSLHLGDAKRIGTACYDQLAPGLENFSWLPLDSIHHFGAEHFYVAPGSARESAGGGIRCSDQARDLERASAPI